MTIHSVMLVLSKINVLLQILRDTRPITLYSERTVANTHVSMVLYFIITYVVHSNLTSHINGMIYERN